MLLPFVCVIGLGLIMYFTVKYDKFYRNMGEGYYISLASIVGVFGGLVIWGMVSGLKAESLAEIETKYKSTPIYSLKNDSEVYGDFTLGCGTVYEIEYYYYFIKNSRGNFERVSTPTYNVEIDEDDCKPPTLLTPYTIKTIRKDKLKHPGLWFIDTDNKVIKTSSYSYKTILRVPKGTIIKNFKID